MKNSNATKKAMKKESKIEESRINEDARNRFNDVMATIYPFIRNDKSEDYNTFGRWTTISDTPVSIPSSSIDCHVSNEDD